MSISNENPIFSPINSVIIDLPSPSSISYLWNFGSLLGYCLVMQIITGVFLAMHYCPDTNLAFSSIVSITSDVNYGYLLNFLHTNGASVLFSCMYIHIARGLYYGSYLNFHLWISGVMIFLVSIITAFIGYVLPWGQMSFWGATVITNFLSAIPYLGNEIVQWIWGGFSIGGATLNSFFSLHYLFPFILIGLTLIHIVLLHTNGSNSPTGLNPNSDKIPFHIYFSANDFYGIITVSLLLSILVFYVPNVLGDPENFTNANPLNTPVHIMPEWYFLFAYAILSSIPNNLGGVIALTLSIFILFFITLTHSSNLNPLTFSPISNAFYWLFIANFMLLTWIGSNPVEEPFILLGQLSSLYYFTYFLLTIPLLGLIENKVAFKT